nr:N-acetyltransferase [Pseudomonas fluorescens]
MALFFRVATVDDMSDLVALEQQCFSSDRLSPRSVRWMIRRANGQLWVAQQHGQLLGYALVLFRRGTRFARLYSLAIAEHARGIGLGNQLLGHIETCALEQGCAYLRLEVRTDNPGALALYDRNGYRRFAVVEDYYQDHTAALRLEKTLPPVGASLLAKNPQAPR